MELETRAPGQSIEVGSLFTHLRRGPPRWKSLSAVVATRNRKLNHHLNRLNLLYTNIILVFFHIFSLTPKPIQIVQEPYNPKLKLNPKHKDSKPPWLKLWISSSSSTYQYQGLKKRRMKKTHCARDLKVMTTNSCIDSDSFFLLVLKISYSLCASLILSWMWMWIEWYEVLMLRGWWECESLMMLL